MYCGNNRLDLKVVNGYEKIGNPYGCLKKGFGKGLRLPPFKGEYSPIVKENIYCGTKKTIPKGYDKSGSNLECFRKGVGAGRKQRVSRKAQHSKSKTSLSRLIVVSTIMVILLLIAACYVYFNK